MNAKRFTEEPVIERYQHIAGFPPEEIASETGKAQAVQLA